MQLSVAKRFDKPWWHPRVSSGSSLRELLALKAEDDSREGMGGESGCGIYVKLWMQLYCHFLRGKTKKVLRSSWFSFFHSSCLHTIHLLYCRLEPTLLCSCKSVGQCCEQNHHEEEFQKEGTSKLALPAEKAEYLYYMSNFSYQNCCIHMNGT